MKKFMVIYMHNWILIVNYKKLHFKSSRQIATPFRPPPPSDTDNMENETRRFNQTAVAYK